MLPTVPAKGRFAAAEFVRLVLWSPGPLLGPVLSASSMVGGLYYGTLEIAEAQRDCNCSGRETLQYQREVSRGKILVSRRDVDRVKVLIARSCSRTITSLLAQATLFPPLC